MKAKCVFCGSMFEPKGRAQKYCEQRCAKLDSRMEREQSGIQVRKRMMAMGAHGDDTMLIVTRKLKMANAPFRERMVILDDMVREKRAVAAQVKDRFNAMGQRRRASLQKKLRALEKRAMQEWRYM